MEITAMYHYSSVLRIGFYEKVDQQLSEYYFNLANSKEDTKAMCEYSKYIFLLNSRILLSSRTRNKNIPGYIDYFKMAADKGSDEGLYALKGNVRSMYLYAAMLKNGDGIQKDEMKTAYLFQKADDKKDKDIMYSFSQRLYDGKEIKAEYLYIILWN